MKKIYQFLCTGRKISTSAVLFLLLCTLQTFAQTTIITIIPVVARWQEADFKVNVNTPTAVTNFTLEMQITTMGFWIDGVLNGVSVQTVTQAAGAEVYTFKVIANCNAPQNDNILIVRLKDNSGVTIATTESILWPERFSIGEADFYFVTPPHFEADFASATKTHTRIWAIITTSPLADVSNLLINNTISNLADFEITKAELVADLAGTPLGAGYELTGGEFSRTGNVYSYVFDENIFDLYGFTGSRFRIGDVIYVKETYLVKTCNKSQSIYTADYGNGTEWCPIPSTYEEPKAKIETGVADIVNSISHFSIYLKDFLPPLETTAKGLYHISNNSSNPKSILRDVSVLTQLWDYSVVITRVYFSDNLGNSFPDVPDLILSPTSNPFQKWIYFDNLTNPVYAVTGLIDADGDGIWNDIPSSTSIFIAFEGELDLAKFGSCNTTLYENQLAVRTHYSDNCDNPNSTVVGYCFALPACGKLNYGPPSNPLVNPINVLPGAKTILTFSETNFNGSGVGGFYLNGWVISKINFDHFVLITLPTGFDYDIASPDGFRINGIPATNITKATIGGRVVLTVQYPGTNDMASTNNYSIDMFFDPAYAIPCEDTQDKKFRIEHEWTWKNDPVHYKYACYDTPLNFLIVDSTKSLEMEFDVQRMTFGWTDYDKTQRITLDNIDSYPGIDRSVAGPYDNVDFVTTLTLKSDTTYNGTTIDDTFEWFAQIGYDAPKTSPLGGCFMFPDPAKAVKIEITGKDEIWLPSSAIDSVRTGNRYIFRLDIAPYTLGNPHYAIGDEVQVTFKMRTTENMPDVLTPVGNVTTTTWLNPPLDTCGVLTSMKSFSVVDYASRDFSNGYHQYYENNIAPSGHVNYTQPRRLISSTTIFPYEYRPNQYVTYYEITFNTLWYINRFEITEYQHTNTLSGVSSITRPLNSSDYTVTHAGGKTTIVTAKVCQSNQISNSVLFYFTPYGIPYCPNPTTATRMVRYLFYPSSERTDITGEYTTINMSIILPQNTSYYTTALEVSPALDTIKDKKVEFTFSLKNLSVWANFPLPSGITQDNVLPNCWLAVTVPPHVGIPTFSITDGSNTWSAFLPTSNPGQYYVRLNNLTVPGATPKKFTLTCHTNTCETFDVQLMFSQSIWGYPDDIPNATKWMDIPICPGKSYGTLTAVPQLSQVRGVTYSPPNPREFCVEHPYSCTFFSTQTGKLYEPELKLTLCEGLEIVPGSVSAIRKGVPTTFVIDDTGVTAERIVTFSFPNDTLDGYVTYADTIRVDFRLRPICGFTINYSVETSYEAKNDCGKLIKDIHYAAPLRLDGVYIPAEFVLGQFNLFFTPPIGSIDLNYPAASVTAKARISLAFGYESTVHDYVTLALPYNFEITSATYTYDGVIFQPLTFVPDKPGINHRLYKADMPYVGGASANHHFELEAILTPVNHHLWNCDTVSIYLVTGLEVELECPPGTPCGVSVETSNRIDAKLKVKKIPVDFFAGSITAAGVYHTNTSEMVTFNGKIVVPQLSDFDDLVIEVFSDASGSMVPIPGVFTTVPHVITGTSVTQFTFPAFTGEIPATDMCNLWLVIRKTSTYNQYICDSVAIQVPFPTYTLVEDEYTICYGKDLQIGDEPITGYTYYWSPDTYITTVPKTTTPVTVRLPHTVTGNYVMALSINRGGCNIGTSVKITLTQNAATADINIAGQTLCYGSKAILAPAAAGVTAPTFRWYKTNAAAVGDFFYEGATYTTTALTADTTIWISVFGDNYCENPVGVRKSVTISIKDTVTPTFLLPLTYCQDEIPIDLSTKLTSIEGITGTWSPTTIATDITALGLSTYTFTPTTGLCARKTKVTVEVNDCSALACPSYTFDSEGNYYKVTKLVGFCWTENLRTTIYSSDGVTPIEWAELYPGANFDIFGLLYTWYSAVGAPEGDDIFPIVPDPITGFVQGICPNGYHLPSRAEWALAHALPAKDIRSKEYWLIPPGPGNDKYNFSALPAGEYSAEEGKFINLYGNTGWWAYDSSTTNKYAFSTFVDYYCNVPQEKQILKINGLSVRCILDY
jgi:uncharacterized protein (TIGR02145 family)